MRERNEKKRQRSRVNMGSHVQFYPDVRLEPMNVIFMATLLIESINLLPLHRRNSRVETICASLIQILRKRTKSTGLLKFVSMSLSCRQRPPSHLGLVHLHGHSYLLSAKNSRNNHFSGQMN